MRQIVLDTETTGLEPTQGHRVIEIGGVEMVNRRLTNNRFHHYLQPDREIDDGAYEVHGISQEFLADKPRFREVADEFLAFVRDAEVIIHNAPFDVAFIDAEFARLDSSPGAFGDYCRVIDSLALARQLHPGQKNSLDALCKRYGIDNAHRQLHGALLDAEILAEAYLAMTGGQGSLELSAGPALTGGVGSSSTRTGERRAVTVLRANPIELEAHRAFLCSLATASEGRALWRTEGDDAPADGTGAKSQ